MPMPTLSARWEAFEDWQSRYPSPRLDYCLFRLKTQWRCDYTSHSCCIVTITGEHIPPSEQQLVFWTDMMVILSLFSIHRLLIFFLSWLV